MMANATVIQVNARPTTISPAVPSGLRITKSFSVAIAVAASVPPIQIGFVSQYKTAVTEPTSLAKGHLHPLIRPAFGRESRSQLRRQHPVGDQEQHQ